MPLVSVCVPVYRAQGYIGACIASVLSQSIASQVELVLVNNATPDGSMAEARGLLEGRAAELAGVRTVTLEENRGPAGARRVAVEASQGDYLAFVDADDALNSLTLELMVDSATRHDAEIVLGSNVALGSSRDGELMDADPPQDQFELAAAMLRGAYPGWLHGKLYARALVERVPEALSCNLGLCEDLFANLALLLAAERIAVAPQAIYRYNLGNQNATTKRLDAARARQAIEADTAIEELLEASKGGEALIGHDLPYRHAVTKLWLLSAVRPWDGSLVQLYNSEHLSELSDLPLPTRSFLRACELGLAPLVRAGVTTVNALASAKRSRAALG